MNNQAYYHDQYSSEPTPLPTIANSNNLAPLNYQPLPPVNQSNYGYGPPLPPPSQYAYVAPPPNHNGDRPSQNQVSPSNNVRARKSRSMCSPKCIGIVCVCACVAVAVIIAIVLAIVIPRLSSSGVECDEGYSILDCSLGKSLTLVQ